MHTVQTVLGAVSPEALGHCQMHEHLFVSEGPATHRFPALLIDDAQRSAQELKCYRQAGGGSVLDAQPGGAGRNAAVLKEISIQSGVHIIAVTGYHMPHFYPSEHWIFMETEDQLCDRFHRELTKGCVEAPDVRPGAVKAALGLEGCEGRTELQFRAAARAAALSKVPIIVHTEKGVGAVKAVNIAKACGVPGNRILICHVDRQADDFAPHDAIAATGAMLEYDTIGRFKYHDDAAEIRLLRHMMASGHTDQLLLSLDTTRERLSSYGGAIGLNYLLDNFLPALRHEGIAEADINNMMVSNPQRVFN